MIHKSKKMDIQTLIILLLTGLAAGIMAGMAGIGGGIVIVPALVYFLGMGQIDAQGTSLALFLFPVGILGVIQYYRQGHVNFSLVAILAIGFLAGSYWGSKVSLGLPPATVKKIFASLMLLVALKMMFFDKADKRKEKESVTSEHSQP